MRALKDEGVKFIFGYPGGAALHIYDSIFKQKDMEHILSAYHDNSAVIKANGSSMLEVGGDDKYKNYKGAVDTTIKVETHNHPTGISPFEGAATGSGGEIRDCSASGRVA